MNWDANSIVLGSPVNAGMMGAMGSKKKNLFKEGTRAQRVPVTTHVNHGQVLVFNGGIHVWRSH